MNNAQEISDDDLLYRRFHRKSLRRDGRLTLATYTLPKTSIPDPEISVDLERLTTPEKTLAAALPGLFGLGVLSAGDVRRLGFTVRYQPIPGNDAHCIIESARLSMRIAHALLLPCSLRLLSIYFL